MGTRKIYFTEDKAEAELEAFMNTEGKLFISLTEKDAMHNGSFIALDKDDAIELISELAFQFDLVNDDLEYPRPIWEGNPR